MAEDNRRSIPPVGQVPEVAMVSFRKMNDSLGLSIVAAIVSRFFSSCHTNACTCVRAHTHTRYGIFMHIMQ